MTAVVDTSVSIDYLRGHQIDYLRGHQGAATLLEQERAIGPLHASDITRLEILAGMRPTEEDGTQLLRPRPIVMTGPVAAAATEELRPNRLTIPALEL